jgi:hypothetical protein
MLVTQPTQAYPVVFLEIEGKPTLWEEFPIPNFRQYLRATIVALDALLDARLFTVEDRARTPDGEYRWDDPEGYHWESFDSVDDWREDWMDDDEEVCVDRDAVDTMAERIRELVGGRQHRVWDGRKEDKLLLRKAHP